MQRKGGNVSVQGLQRGRGIRMSNGLRRIRKTCGGLMGLHVWVGRRGCMDS